MKAVKGMASILAVLLMLTSLVSISYAMPDQGSSGSVTGQVVTYYGQAIGGATVEVSNASDPSQTYTAITNDSGYYSIAGLPAGQYTATFSHDGVGQTSASFSIADGSVTAMNAEITPVPYQINMNAQPQSIIANGSDYTMITTSAVDYYGHGIAGLPLSFKLYGNFDDLGVIKSSLDTHGITATSPTGLITSTDSNGNSVIYYGWTTRVWQATIIATDLDNASLTANIVVQFTQFATFTPVQYPTMNMLDFYNPMYLPVGYLHGSSPASLIQTPTVTPTAMPVTTVAPTGTATATAAPTQASSGGNNIVVYALFAVLIIAVIGAGYMLFKKK
jgi:hypothetical protein